MPVYPDCWDQREFSNAVARIIALATTDEGSWPPTVAESDAAVLAWQEQHDPTIRERQAILRNVRGDITVD